MFLRRLSRCRDVDRRDEQLVIFSSLSGQFVIFLAGFPSLFRAAHPLSEQFNHLLRIRLQQALAE